PAGATPPSTATSPAATAASSKPATMTSIEGVVVTPRKYSALGDGIDGVCWTFGNEPIGFGGSPTPVDDVKKGAQVVATDATGRVGGIGRLGAGVALRDSDGIECNFQFTIPDVPAGSAFYGIRVGNQ